jgi:hypothetical protein
MSSRRLENICVRDASVEMHKKGLSLAMKLNVVKLSRRTPGRYLQGAIVRGIYSTIY